MLNSKNEKGILSRFIHLFSASGLTKSEFAFKVDLSHSSLNKYLNNEIDIQKVSLRLHNQGYSIDWLYSGMGEPVLDGIENKQLSIPIKELNYSKQKERIKSWIEYNYDNIIEFEIARDFERHEVQRIFESNKSIPYLILKRIENAGCNINWSITGTGNSYSNSIIGQTLKQKNHE